MYVNVEVLVVSERYSKKQKAKDNIIVANVANSTDNKSNVTSPDSRLAQN